MVYPRAISPPRRRTLTSNVIRGDMINGVSVTHSCFLECFRGKGGVWRKNWSEIFLPFLDFTYYPQVSYNKFERLKSQISENTNQDYNCQNLNFVKRILTLMQL